MHNAPIDDRQWHDTYVVCLCKNPWPWRESTTIKGSSEPLVLAGRQGDNSRLQRIGGLVRNLCVRLSL